MPKIKILIVEDEIITAEALRLDLKDMGYEVCSLTSSGEKAIKIAENEKPDIVLMDFRLRGELNGFEAGKEIRSRFGIPSIYMSGYLEEEMKEEMEKDGSFRWLQKPFERFELRNMVDSVLQKKNGD